MQSPAYLLKEFQSRFSSGFGIEEALVAIIDDICQERDKWNVILLILLDLSVTFGDTDHGILLEQLCQMGSGSTVTWWLLFYLQSQFQKAALGDFWLAPWHLCSRVPQSSILPLIFFNIYTKL